MRSSTPFWYLLHFFKKSKFRRSYISTSPFWFYIEGVIPRCSVKKVFLKISQNSQENTCVRVSFLIKVLIKKETLAQVFSCEIFKNTYFYRTSLVNASVYKRPARVNYIVSSRFNFFRFYELINIREKVPNKSNSKQIRTV